MSRAEELLNEMSRGIVVIDANLLDLVSHLADKNITVRPVPQNMSDEEIKRSFLAHRIFITNNTKDFIDDAVPMQYALISTEGMRSKDPAMLAKTIDQAVVKFKLWSKQASGWILRLKADGKHEFEVLPR